MKYTEVAVGVLIRKDGAVLFGQRPIGKPYAGWWEFPGGKLESGESVEAALARELSEELGINVLKSEPWVVRTHVYPHARVRLHFQKVTAWEGEPQSREKQALRWVAIDDTLSAVEPLLPASWPVIFWLKQPQIWLLNPDLNLDLNPDLGSDVNQSILLKASVVLHQPSLSPTECAQLIKRALDMFGKDRVWVSSIHDSHLIRQAAGSFIVDPKSLVSAGAATGFGSEFEPEFGPYEAFGGWAQSATEVASLVSAGARFVLVPPSLLTALSRTSEVPVYSWRSPLTP